MTHNGNVTMTIPDTTTASFTIRTYNGTFSTALPVKGPAASDVPREQRISYALGNGSADVELESFGGTIRLMRAGEGATREKENDARDQ